MWRLNKNMMVQMPTGIGKLHSLASVIHEHLQERQRQSVWIATHRRELVEQIEDPLLPAAVWCAKEALYKYARRPGLDLLHDLRVEAVDFAAGTVVGRIGGGEAIRLTLHRADGFITVYTV